jgi:hypothetical protein
MELGSEARLLQSRLLERLGQPISCAALLVSSAARSLGQSSRLSRQLGLSPAQLPPAALPTAELSSPETWTSRQFSRWPPSIAR